MNENVKELIDAMEAGKSLDIEASFNAIMSEKMVDAINTKRTEIAGSLFQTPVSEE